MNINLNTLFNSVRNLSNDDTSVIMPSGGGWQTTKQVSSLTTDQQQANIDFRNGLYQSLKGTGVDETVLAKVRAQLGIPESGDGKVVPNTPLSARNVRDAINAVMGQVNAQINKVLSRKFSSAVMQLIQEAVRENPQHAVVKEFLATSNVDNLARLCRLTQQSQDGVKDTWSLSYLDGFAYTVKGLEGVRSVLDPDKNAYLEGREHFDSEKNLETENLQKPNGTGSEPTTGTSGETKDKASVDPEKQALLKNFSTAVEACKDEIAAFKKSLESEKSELVKGEGTQFLSDLENLKKTVGTDNSTEVYRLLCSLRRQKAEDKDATDDGVQTAINDGLKRIIDDKKKLLNVSGLNVQPKLLKPEEMDLQGATNMCYVRALGNGLLLRGKELPTCNKDGTYIFKVDVGLVGPQQLTVKRSEIEALKNWYQARSDAKDPNYASYGSHKESLQDLDWALNIALAKKKMLESAEKNIEKTDKEQKKLQPLLDLTIDDLEKGNKDLEGTYLNALGKQRITEFGDDSQMAEFFGLTTQDSISINYVGYKVETGLVKQPPAKDLFASWNRAREWLQKNPKGVMTLNESNRHFVQVSGFYYTNDDDFGFIVRDSSSLVAQETKVKIPGFHYDGDSVDGKCQTLGIHCYTFLEQNNATESSDGNKSAQ